jgi:hypothetical protein
LLFDAKEHFFPKIVVTKNKVLAFFFSFRKKEKKGLFLVISFLTKAKKKIRICSENYFFSQATPQKLNL